MTAFITDAQGRVIAISLDEVTFGFDAAAQAFKNLTPVLFNTTGAMRSLSFELQDMDKRAVAILTNDEEALVRMDLEDDPDFDMDEYLELKARFPENPHG